VGVFFSFIFLLIGPPREKIEFDTCMIDVLTNLAHVVCVMVISDE